MRSPIVRSVRIASREVERLTRTLVRRITHYLRQRARLSRESESDQADAPDVDESLISALCAESVQGRLAIQAQRSSAVTQHGRRRERCLSFMGGALCYAVDSFSLHADVLVPEERRELHEDLRI